MQASCVLAALFTLFLTPASAQVATAELNGAVTDASGAAVPGARISAINADTNVTVREIESGADS
jgi:hypothetical protein